MAFATKKMSVTITLAPLTDANGKVVSQPTFSGSNGATTVTLDGYRMSAHINKAGGASLGELQLRIYGLGLQLMNQLSTMGRVPLVVGKNSISVMAGDDTAGITDVFDGTIIQAYTDLNGAPDAIFDIQAYAGMYEGLKTITTTSFKGATDVAVVMSSIAQKMGLSAGFQNQGVQGIFLSDPFFHGDAKTQADLCAMAANIRWVIDNNAMIIWPNNGSRGGAVPLISPQTGLIGYPFPAGQGLLGLRTTFNPGIVFGSKIEVKSSIDPANGIWAVTCLNHELEVEMPGGKWESSITAIPPGYLTR